MKFLKVSIFVVLSVLSSSLFAGDWKWDKEDKKDYNMSLFSNNHQWDFKDCNDHVVVPPPPPAGNRHEHEWWKNYYNNPNHNNHGHDWDWDDDDDNHNPPPPPVKPPVVPKPFVFNKPFVTPVLSCSATKANSIFTPDNSRYTRVKDGNVRAWYGKNANVATLPDRKMARIPTRIIVVKPFAFKPETLGGKTIVIPAGTYFLNKAKPMALSGVTIKRLPSEKGFTYSLAKPNANVMLTLYNGWNPDSSFSWSKFSVQLGKVYDKQKTSKPKVRTYWWNCK